jgi:hypothetical protein
LKFFGILLREREPIMKNLITKTLSATSLFVVVLLAACGSNNCPSGQAMYNNQCTYTQNIPGYNNGMQTGSNCSLGQLYSPQYGCLQTNINGCTGNMGWSPQANTCVAGTPVTNTGYNNGYNTGYNNGYGQPTYNGNTGVGGGFYYGVNTGYNNCQNGFVMTRAYGCLPQGGCPYGTGMGPFGCTY